MDQTLHFISGLPRSGSTLLAALLRQNPRFHASISSPVAALMNGMLEQIGAGSEFYRFFDQDKRRALCEALFKAYYAEHQGETVIFDTNRSWTARMHQLEMLWGEFKMIVCVRNPAWIVDSFETLYRNHPLDYSRVYSGKTRGNIYSRAESLMAHSGVIGSAWAALKEAYYGPLSDRLLLVDYELLAKHPEKCLSLVYDFLEESPFKHDVNKVAFEDAVFDRDVGVEGLHSVRGKVELQTRATLLPPDVFKTYSEMAFWHDTKGTRANLISHKSY
ncbi:sulfotransferase [Temperatibacter marinus]|uniref:Sulfotransferase n=1 Tax=Temperatibacter marinus TaxID=1456591 RepID=A0AA52EAR4_9PROT|nr:sulfotransferase [Temperatibacter marinus]WND01396.1 sulfotransferase [Temperatibacter marinus]